MPRHKEFDVDAACERALDLFWRRGYEATSVNDLVDELGIGKASLYAAFGAKHQLYLAALQRYVERSGARIVTELGWTDLRWAPYADWLPPTSTKQLTRENWAA